MSKNGLSTSVALAKLRAILREEVNNERRKLLAERPESSMGCSLWGLGHREGVGSCYCIFYVTVLSVISALLLAPVFGSAFNMMTIIATGFFLLTILLNTKLSIVAAERRRHEMVDKASDLLARLSNSRDNSTLQYRELGEPTSDSIHLQYTIRDNKVVNVPWMLLVEGDVIMLRAGHPSPCRCVSDKGEILLAGEKPSVEQMNCDDSDGVIPLEPRKYLVCESPLVNHLRVAFAEHRKKRSSLIDKEVRSVCHIIVEQLVLPISCFFIFIALALRVFLLSDRNATLVLLISHCASTLLPLLGPMFPLFFFIAKYWNMAYVLHHIRFINSNSDIPGERALIFTENGLSFDSARSSAVAFALSFYRLLAGDPSYLTASADFIFSVGGLTTLAFLDKKGVLSWPNATVEKVFFFRKQDPVTDGHDGKIIPQVLDLSLDGDGPFRTHFDDPCWQRFLGSLLPLGENILLNSCAFDASYVRLLDHVAAVSDQVPRTIAIANRRCACYFAELLGFESGAAKQFDLASSKTLGIYKRLPGDAPLPGLTKHRTPVENAFLTITGDSRSLHHHVMAQGTSELILGACSYLWSGDSLHPLNRNARRKAANFYQRHCMTGYCLALSYRTSGCTVSDRMSSRYIDVPLATDPDECSQKYLEIPRSLSFDSAAVNAFFRDSPIDSARDCLNEFFSDHIFCGFIVMQYQARPDAVRLIEQLDHACIRFVHFSKENELRSRVFAEKLGLEAGWNCHVSLASEGNNERAQQQYFGSDFKLHTSRPTNAAMLSRRSFAGMRSPSRTGFSYLKSFARDTWVSCTPLLADSDVEVQPEKNVPIFVCDSAVEGETSLDEVLNAPSENALTCTDVHMKDSPSHHSMYSWNEEAAPGPMPNKAQLPSGIENIRPHLENIDNVPLLVNLFTDCDQHTTRAMIEIMQDYGEVVLAVGSSLNSHNGLSFAQSNCAICLEPEQPVVCCKKKKPVHGPPIDPLQTAAGLATSLMGICANVDLFCNQEIDLISIISLCRHRLRLTRSAVIFYLLSSFAVFLVQAISLAFSPLLLFRPFQMSLFILIYIPLLSLSLLASPFNRQENLEQIAPKNSVVVPRKMVHRIVFSFVVALLPLFMFNYFLLSSLAIISSTSNADQAVRSERNFSNFMSEDSVESCHHFAAMLLLLYFCIISFGYVHIRHNFWIKSPLRNIYWLIACFVAVSIQSTYALFSAASLKGLLKLCSPILLSISVAWLVITVALNELCKKSQIKLYARDQRRRKLCFNTKLGMNSPY